MKSSDLLTLGAHAQRGLLYLVCVSVCLCVRSRFLPLDATRSPKLYSNGFGATFASRGIGMHLEGTEHAYVDPTALVGSISPML